jgi:hypothetical protein
MGVDSEFSVAGRKKWLVHGGLDRWAPAGGGGACFMIDGGGLRRCLELFMLSGDLVTPLMPCMIYLKGGVSA